MEHHFGGTCSCHGVKKDTHNMKTHVSCKRIGNVMVRRGRPRCDRPWVRVSLGSNQRL